MMKVNHIMVVIFGQILKLPLLICGDQMIILSYFHILINQVAAYTHCPIETEYCDKCNCDLNTNFDYNPSWSYLSNFNI
jgi:hypothetical protein